MKRTLKLALAASVAAMFATAVATPSMAQQDDMAAPKVTRHSTYKPAAPRARVAPVAPDEAATEGGYEAYDYAPAAPGWGGDSCATQGTYGKGADYANCY